MTSDLTQLGFVLFVSALVAMLTRRLHLPYTVGLVLAGMRATRNNPGASHENGSIESRQGTVKHALNQALLLRGSRNFAQLGDYRSFVAEVAMRLNARVIKALTIERACLQPLPHRRQRVRESIGNDGSEYLGVPNGSAAFRQSRDAW